MLIIDSDSVCGPVAVLILRDHHRDGERLETVTRQRDADVPAAWTTTDGRGQHGRRRENKQGGGRCGGIEGVKSPVSAESGAGEG